MESSKGNGAKLLLLVGIAIAFAALNPDFTKRIIGQCRDLFSRTSGNAPGATSSQPGASPDSDAQTQAQSTVEAYMRKNAAPQCTLSFLDWSDFSTSGPASAITVRYNVANPPRQDVLATVRFTIQAGSVVKAEMVGPGLQPAATPAVRPVAVWTPPPVVVDRFSAPLFAAMHGDSMTLHLSDAFSLGQLEEAKERAQAERKPIGFIMVWGQFFDHEADPRSKGSDSALVHFYEVFHDHLVLVFVRHETELNAVPPAVMRGFGGANEGGYAPNMAVVDATATEFIVEIPFRGLDGAGRDPLFAAGGRTIDEWLATHPAAMATPGAANP